MFRKFSEEAKKILINAKKEMQALCHPYVGSEHLMLAILKNKDNEYVVKLKKYGVTYTTFKNELIKVIGLGKIKSEFFLYTPLLKNIIYNAICDSEDKNKDYVEVDDLLLALFDEGEGIAIRLMLGMNIKINDIYNEFVSDFNKPKTHNKLYVETFGVDLNKKVINKEIDPVVGREKEIDRIMEILGRRTKNNPLLLGEAGVGKTAIVEELARRIVEDRVGANLKNKKIISISMSNLVAGTKYRGEFEDRVSKIIKELENNNNIIIFIDEIHTLVGAGGAEGAIDASNIFKPALARGKIKVIGATTKEEYKKTIMEDKALDRRFQIIDICEPTIEETKDILLKIKPIYENFHQVRISNDTINDIIYLSDKFLYDREMPDKAIDVMDEASSKVALSNNEDNNKIRELNLEHALVKDKKNKAIINNNFQEATMYKEQEIKIEDEINNLEILMVNNKTIKEVTKQDIMDVIKAKSKIPVYEMIYDTTKLRRHLLDKVKGQEATIDKLININKKVCLNIRTKNKPISILFAGSTGTGKTFLAKEYTKEFLGINNFIKIDMSEYKEAHSISKIIGSPPGYIGYSDNKNILEEIKEKPHSVILLDEIDKAHRNVIELFLQILDDGKIKNSKGEEIRFDNNIIIMTFNIKNNINKVGFNSTNEEKYYEILKNKIGIEILNRLDYISYFNNMTEDIISDIVKDSLNLLINSYKGEELNIKFNNKLVGEIIRLSEYNIYGARKINKIIDNYIDSVILGKLLDGEKDIKIDELKVIK